MIRFPVRGAADITLPAVESRAVFADPSGRRHRILRLAGLGVAALLATCLGAVVVALTGGPHAPFTRWAAPQVLAASPTGHAAPQAAGHVTARSHASRSVTATGVPVTGQKPGIATKTVTPTATAHPSVVPSPRPTSSPKPSVTPQPSLSPTPTKSGGGTSPTQTPTQGSFAGAS